MHEHFKLAPRLGRTAVRSGVKAKIQSRSPKQLVTNPDENSHAYAWRVGQIVAYKYLVQFDVGTSSSVVSPKVLSLIVDRLLDGQTSRGVKKNGINNIQAKDLLTFVAAIIVQLSASGLEIP